MKSFRTTGLIALVILGCAPEIAKAQSGAYSTSLLPWPNSYPSATTRPAGYYAEPTPADPAQSADGTVAQPPQPEVRSDLDGALHAPASDWGCEACGTGCSGSEWYGAAYGLVMSRTRPLAFGTTVASNDPSQLLLSTGDAKAGWTGGGQITLGCAWNGCGGPSLAFTYWSLGPMDGSASVSDNTGNPATALSSTLIWTGLTINGTPATTFFDNAQEQAIWRRDRTNNFEMNLLSSTYSIGSFQVAGLAGFRYFRFGEDLTYGSASFGNSFSSNGGADAAYLAFKVRNNLYGGQFGAVLTSLLTNRLTVFIVPKVGIYGNQMNNQTLIYAGDAVNSPDVNFNSHKSDVAVLSELDFGLAWAFNPNWRLTYGYRVVAVNNVALGDNQFGSYGFVEQNGNLILHGAFIGVSWAF